MCKLKFYGIKHGYPILYKYLGKLVTYVQLCRIFTLLAPIFGALSMSVIFLAHTNQLNQIFNLYNKIIYGAVTLVMCNMASNIYNQVYDVEIDKISKPYRPIPMGLITSDEALTVSIFIYLFALLRAITVNLWFGVFILIIICITISYSSPAIRLKKYLWINLAGAIINVILNFIKIDPCDLFRKINNYANYKSDCERRNNCM